MYDLALAIPITLELEIFIKARFVETCTISQHVNNSYEEVSISLAYFSAPIQSKTVLSTCIMYILRLEAVPFVPSS